MLSRDVFLGRRGARARERQRRARARRTTAHVEAIPPESRSMHRGGRVARIMRSSARLGAASKRLAQSSGLAGSTGSTTTQDRAPPACTPPTSGPSARVVRPRQHDERARPLARGRGPGREAIAGGARSRVTARNSSSFAAGQGVSSARAPGPTRRPPHPGRHGTRTRRLRPPCRIARPPPQPYPRALA